MKALALVLALTSLSAFAQSKASNGTSKVYSIMEKKLVLVVEGDSARRLYDKMSGIKVFDLGQGTTQKVGENMNCAKVREGKKPVKYQCEIVIEDNRGTVGVGAAG